MRLDKFITHTTHFSRRQVRSLINHKRIYINNIPATSSAEKLPHNSQVTLDGQRLSYPCARYFMLHKPIGYECTNQGGEHPSVLDLLHESNTAALQIAGRLDLDTSGLVLLTDNGEWNHKITSPKVGKQKAYQLSTAEPINPELVALFATGFLLKNDTRPTRPAELTPLGSHSARLVLSEGRYHQIKRMFAAHKNRVTQLHREAIGEISLDSQLAPGQYRPLTPEEIASVR